MKLVSFDRSGFPAAGVLDDARDAVLPIRIDAPGADPEPRVSMADLLGDWRHWVTRLPGMVAAAADADWVPRSDLELLAPVPNPGSFICIGLNYRDHALETGAAVPAEPIVFAKHVASIVADGEAVVLPTGFDEVDFEAELAVVIGEEVFRVDARRGLAAVAGYTIVNDISARDRQAATGQWMVAKSYPTFGPMGPALVTADDFGDGRGRGIGLRVNDRVLQDSSTDELIFGVGEIVSHLSQVFPLRPGDVIATGTPAGVGFTRTPPVFLRDGDVVEAWVDGIGRLCNPVRAEAAR